MAEGVTGDESKDSANTKKDSDRPKSGSRRSRFRSAPSRQRDNIPLPENTELSPLPGTPRIIPRDEHCISRKNIDSECLKVMGRLIRYGHRAFLVGGGVRDLLLEKAPKDFDVSTDASPEQIRKLFRNSRIFGRRFKLNHVFFQGGKTIEVSTFRAESTPEPDEEIQTLAKDNTYGDPETDALRRDLTINGLFYDLSTYSIVDYINGMDDLEKKTVRVIGEPKVRFQEDPVRMIRAVRHAARTGFEIEPVTYKAICELADVLSLAPKARLFEEFQREISGGYCVASFTLLNKTGLLPYLYPKLSALIASSDEASALFERRIKRIDARIAAGDKPRVGLLFGALLFDLLDAKSFGDNKMLEQYWVSNPEFGADELTSTPPPSRSTKVGNRRKSSPLLQFIDRLFDDVGLPRKERERLERALVGRLSLLEYKPDDAFGRRLKRSASIEDALSLARFVDLDDSQEDVLQKWGVGSKDSSAKKKPSKPRRRNRNRNRNNQPKDVDGNVA